MSSGRPRNTDETVCPRFRVLELLLVLDVVAVALEDVTGDLGGKCIVGVAVVIQPAVDCRGGSR